MKKATLRQELYMFRLSKGMTQEQFAETLGYKRDCYGRVENGDRDPSMKFCKALSEAWSIPLPEVFKMLNLH